jgi:hypothetical protein
MMNETRYLVVGGMAAVKVRNHKLLSYGTTVLIKKMHGNTITVVPLVDDKAYFVDANILHNNLMPYF